MRIRLLAAFLLLAPVLALAQSSADADDLLSGMKKLKDRTSTQTSTLPAGQAAAADQLALSDLDAAEKAQILARLDQLMALAEKNHRVYQDHIDVSHKFLGIGKTVRYHLCAGPNDQLAFDSGRPRCHGDLLSVAWSDTDVVQESWEAPSRAPAAIDGGPAHDLFYPNKFEIDPNSKDGQALAAQARALTAALQAGAQLVRVDVFSSASTLRNTGDAGDLSHADLSRLRAEKAFAFVLSQLPDDVRAKAGAAWNFSRSDAEGNDMAYLDFGAGESCNGTSGPNPPSNYVWTSDLDKNAAGTAAAAPTEQGRAAVRAQYDQYQYVDVSFEVLQPAAPAETTTTQTSSQDFSAFVGVAAPTVSSGGGGGGGLPRFRFRIGRRSRKHWGSTACPTF